MTGSASCTVCGTSAVPQMYAQHQDADGNFNAGGRGTPINICVGCVATDERAAALRSMIFLPDDDDDA